MLPVVIFLAAALPSLVLLAIFLRFDRFPEPRGVVLRTFFLGMAVILPVVVVSLPLMGIATKMGSAWMAAGFQAFVLAGMIEESAKFWVLYGYCMKNAAFDEPMDGLVYGMTASLGFACLENIAFVESAGDQWMMLAAVRAFLAVPAHGMNGAIMGYYAARARFNAADRTDSYRKALLVPIALHGLYDFTPLLVQSSTEGMSDAALDASSALIAACSFSIVAFEVLWVLRLFRQHRAVQDLPPPCPQPPAPVPEGPETERDPLV
ncbi:MAG: PrsW family intramembrane metalloprotease [Candidatus Eisenbacteria bacterium]